MMRRMVDVRRPCLNLEALVEDPSSFSRRKTAVEVVVGYEKSRQTEGGEARATKIDRTVRFVSERTLPLVQDVYRNEGGGTRRCIEGTSATKNAPIDVM